MNHPIIPALEAAVPLNALEMQRTPLTDLWSTFERDRDQVVDSLACKGDVLLFGHGKHKGKKGEIAKVFNQLAKMLGFMSVAVPGGVRLFGCHWEFPHPDLTTKQQPDGIAEILECFHKQLQLIMEKTER